MIRNDRRAKKKTTNKSLTIPSPLIVFNSFERAQNMNSFERAHSLYVCQPTELNRTLTGKLNV